MFIRFGVSFQNLKYSAAEFPFARTSTKRLSFFRIGADGNIKKIMPSTVGLVAVTNDFYILAAHRASFRNPFCYLLVFSTKSSHNLIIKHSHILKNVRMFLLSRTYDDRMARGCVPLPCRDISCSQAPQASTCAYARQLFLDCNADFLLSR